MTRGVPARRRVGSALATALLGFGLTTAAATAPPCPGPTLTLTPTTTQGDVRLAEVTAQTLEVGVAGWAEVAWSTRAAGAVDLVVESVDGTRTTVPDPDEGHASGVRALRFCSAPDG